VNINRDEYRSKVLGCWLGKNIGGTLGAPMEWRRQTNHVTFYTQELGGEPLPNDDLDIQLLWVIAMERHGVDLDAHTLADYWCFYVTPHWAEYGTGKINMRSGLLPPLSGTYRNDFKDSCGSFIRSEIWACIAPGQPGLAARYAFEDAILDHGNGEGTYAEVFTATLESAAFVVGDACKLIDIGLSYIPADCGTARAIRCAVDAFDRGLSPAAARDEILIHHRGSAAFNRESAVSPEDLKKGYAKGKLGYDVPSNIAIWVYGLLYGGDDFEKTMCTTVNMGEDTDCTGATVGSIFGIIHGAGAIPRRWTDPIGRAIKTITLDLGDLQGIVPATVDELTDRTERLARQVALRHSGIGLENGPTELGEITPKRLRATDGGASIYSSMSGPRFRFDYCTVCLDYGPSPTIRPGEPKRVRVTIHSEIGLQTNLSLRWYLPEGWSVRPGPQGAILLMPPHFAPPPTLEFELVAERLDRTMNRAVIELTVEGRPTVMLVPVTLLSGVLLPPDEPPA